MSRPTFFLPTSATNLCSRSKISSVRACRVSKISIPQSRSMSLCCGAWPPSATTLRVSNFAKLTKASGLDGVVCSAQEARLLRDNFGQDFCLVTPGIRPADASLDDQSRVVTPHQALELGSSYLVIGRPITQSQSPLETLQKIHQEISLSF